MKTITITVFALIISMIVSAPLHVYADSQLDSLLRIANQARDNIKIRLSQLETMPDEINTIYEQGSSETDELEKSVLSSDVNAAKQHFSSAMNLFKEASEMISSNPSVGDSLSSVDLSRLKTSISRIETDATRLKALANNNSIVIDFTEFDNLIQIAKQDLDAGKTDDVTKTIGVAKQFLSGAYSSLAEAAKQRVTDRAKNFASKQIENLGNLISQAQELGLSQDIIDNLQIAKEKLEKVSDPIQIVSHTKDINTIKEKLNSSTINRLNAIIHQFEIKIENLDKQLKDEDSKAKIQNANNMIGELRQVIQENNLREALQKISSINEIIKGLNSTIETSTDTTDNPSVESNDSSSKVQTENSSTIKTSNTTNNVETKSDRLNEKIQSLENQLNDLSQSITNNEIAIKWIKHGLSLVDDAKSQVEKSPEKATTTINEIEKIIVMIQRISS